MLPALWYHCSIMNFSLFLLCRKILLWESYGVQWSWLVSRPRSSLILLRVLFFLSVTLCVLDHEFNNRKWSDDHVNLPVDRDVSFIQSQKLRFWLQPGRYTCTTINRMGVCKFTHKQFMGTLHLCVCVSMCVLLSCFRHNALMQIILIY